MMARLQPTMSKESASEDRYSNAASKRQDRLFEILQSSEEKKIVVAGPGTGKTYLFKQLLKDKKRTLTLTFVNSLVEDLSLELCGLSEVKTLHSFARGQLQRFKPDTKVFPKLSLVIQQDATLLLNRDVDFDRLFHNRDDENPDINFYRERKDYYKHYGFADIVFSVATYFEAHADKIPAYEQLLVDEFQDFNKLEVSLIDLLARRSPILIVGDDDQALYHFKDANTKYIRERCCDPQFGYKSFPLPYCSRCTRVIIEATTDVIKRATEEGHLRDRIPKDYEYLEEKAKDAECEENPKIIHAILFATQIPFFIEKQIGEIAKERKSKFSVLIICPFNRQAQKIVTGLKNKGLQNVEYFERPDQTEATLLDGLKILLEDKKSNLGWRIVSRCRLPKPEFASLLKETLQTSIDLYDLVDKTFKEDVNKMLNGLRAIKKGDEIEDEQLDEMLAAIGLNPYQATRHHLKHEIDSISRRPGNVSIRQIPIKVTTIQGSKGLAAEYVFITHFDALYCIQDKKDKTKISDPDISNFLVALTRAKRRVFLISSKNQPEHPFRWINKDRMQEMSAPSQE